MSGRLSELALDPRNSYVNPLVPQNQHLQEGWKGCNAGSAHPVTTELFPPQSKANWPRPVRINLDFGLTGAAL
jgi:hypothetical protein